MAKNLEVGRTGEDEAARFLKRKGFVVLLKNEVVPGGEIDIISRSPDGTLVFVEVKTMDQGGNNRINPEDNMTRAKMEKVRRSASLFANANSKLVRGDRGWRIDLIAITLGDNSPVISHYENI